MVRSIIYGSMNTYYWESCKDTSFGSFFDTFAYCRDVFLRNSTTNNCRIKLEEFISVGIHRLEFNFTVSVLSTSTRLFCIFVFLINWLCKCLFVSNLWSTYVCFYVEFTKQTVNDDFQMELTHTSDDGLSCFCICMSTESRIFFCKFCKSFTHLTLSSFCLRLDSKLDNWLWEFHGL